MNDEYQIRRDIDRLYDGIYDYNSSTLKTVNFRDKSPLKSIGRTDNKTNTLDDLFEYYGLQTITSNTYTKSETDNLLDDKVSLGDLVDLIYPIGSIYISTSSANPSTLFTGTVWNQIEGRFLLGAGDLTDENDTVLDSYSLGDEDGEHEHTLTTTEMPSHNHKNFEWNIIVAQGGNTGYYNTPSVNSSHTGGWGVMRDDANQNRYSGSTGGGQAHNNMPPYLAVNIWERIE